MRILIALVSWHLEKFVWIRAFIMQFRTDFFMIVHCNYVAFDRISYSLLAVWFVFYARVRSSSSK